MPDVSKHSDESDTASSSDDPDQISALYERGNKVIPHAIVHFPSQVVMGGTHQFHNTSANEASHKSCLQEAGLRAQTFSDENMSANSMLQYKMDRLATEHIVQAACGA